MAELVHNIRRSEEYVPDLALVAEEEGDIVGHIVMSYAALQGKEEMSVLLLSPLGVRSDHQRRGIGAALVGTGLGVADARKEPLVVVEGVPSYYPRLGFERARSHGIEPPHSKVPDEAWMVQRLSAYTTRFQGRVVYPAAFDAFA
ncbi:MAG: N-acetyltransferase [Actinomycetota bacterium]|nr:N-acetyltransferase [Actinomycetota bacterium]